MRNKYPGICLRCGKPVAVGEGYFQRKPGGWSVRCEACVGKGNEPLQQPTPESQETK